MTWYRFTQRLRKWGEDFLSLLLGLPPIHKDDD